MKALFHNVILQRHLAHALLNGQLAKELTHAVLNLLIAQNLKVRMHTEGQPVFLQSDIA